MMPTTDAIHPTAIIETTEIGENVHIGPFTRIEAGARIGNNVVIGQGCHIQSGVVLNDGIHVDNGVYIWQGVYLEEKVFVGPQVVFTNVLNPRVDTFPPSRERLLQTKVGRGASLGANSTILCGHIIGPHAVVGAGSTLTHSVRAHELVVGNPARHQGWACECGEHLFDIRSCLRCGREYEMIDTGLRRIKGPDSD
jgi:UDP-2-acetamido-3-amino-2,3-dideoxy-glucuronate N-acetyltransferase